MALPTKTQLLELDTSWLGRPFVQVEAKARNTTELDVSWLGKPFVGAAGSTPPVSSYPIYVSMFTVL